MSKPKRSNVNMTLAVCSAIVAAALRRRRSPPPTSRRPRGNAQVHITASRAFNQSSALLALSVLADSTVEHYRGLFRNPAMFTPLLSATLSLLAGLHGGRDRASRSHPVRRGIYGFATVAGIAGTGFHLYNVTKRAGGWSWNNLFYAAPLGAPTALLLSGGLGAIAERLRDEPASEPRLLGMPAGKALALVVSAGLLGTVGEMGLLHFRGAFQHPAMYAPVILPPVAAGLLVQTAFAAPHPQWDWSHIADVQRALARSSRRTLLGRWKRSA